MKILKLSLKNFKGIRSFTLDTRGGNIDIYGDNATGKTTLFDAFIWLLFDKDSQNRKDFDIKTLDQNGQPFHGLEHEVEGVFDIGGRTIALRKVYAEKWTKKRGSAEKTFTGHTTDYYIDGVPVKKNEYTARIADIADEEAFKLLTNPLYFNTQLHWQDRRKILLQVCGDISDEEVIASDKSLSRLPDILQGRKLEDHRKVIAARRAEINKELDRIPVRIDEVQQYLPNITDIDPEKTAQKISTLKEAVKEKELQIARIESGGEIAEKTKALREVESQLLEIKNKHRSKYESWVQEQQKQLNEARERFYNLQGDIKSLERSLASNQEAAQRYQKQMDELRQEWHRVNAQEFTFEQDDTCPTCGQPLPAEKLAEAREKALARFNREKAERLESISAQGKELKAKAGELVAENAEIEKKLKDARAKLVDAEAAVNSLQKEVESLRQAMDGYADDPAYVQALNQKQELEAAIAALKGGRREEIQRVREEIAYLEQQIRQAESALADIERFNMGQKRIEELKEQERRLAAEFEKLEGELYLTEQFIRTKVNLLEEKINSRFKFARFKLFDVQVNGGVVECCETIYNGVPYSSGLNNAARINVGLDIINTLSEYYGFTAPIFVDNREAVTKLIETRAQVISLIVSEADKKLRVEYPETESKLDMREAV
ncbi:AAA family ATPase [Desulfoscipio geothermicus]|uniref:Nuclease SbcCD subunit C n=1 Tax=Desulfoscipio geothermicus DSM 3669 TaxID=1121426 RepID=A0A1I6ECA6_9FIRM|nr:AAA family ATPase [Desulfoscipio geothermicus]SFR15383.1 AAA domain-containing protein [Desulfoscipio geothermicus DSM 3669]